MADETTRVPTSRTPLFTNEAAVSGLRGPVRSPPWMRGYHPARWGAWRARGQALLSSKRKHFAIMAMVALDVVALLVDILVTLVACDMDRLDEPWVGETQEGTKICGLVFSCLFLGELILSVWAFGLSYFSSWFHCFDAAVIVGSFIVDILAHGIAGQIASLVIVLRLTRLVKIVNELGLASAERMEDLEARMRELERENEGLKEQVAMRRLTDNSDGR